MVLLLILLAEVGRGALLLCKLFATDPSPPLCSLSLALSFVLLIQENPVKKYLQKESGG